MDQLTKTVNAANTRILSVGSGDGSQQAAIFSAGHRKIVTTFFDDEATVLSKYGSSASSNIALLRSDPDSSVLFNVDAAKLHKDNRLQGFKFGVIIFFFPHTGTRNFRSRNTGPSHQSIRENKQLIEKFLLSAQHLLTERGEIQIALKTSAPYDRWTFPEFFQDRFQIKLLSQHTLDKKLFPGYVHRSTLGEKCGVASVNSKKAKVYVFGKGIQENNKNNNSCCENERQHDPPFDIQAGSIHILLDNNDDMDHHHDNVAEQEIAEITMEILEQQNANDKKKSLNVLEIRRMFPETIRPDPSQLNRVLYDLASKRRIVRAPPAPKKPNKPTWKAAL